MSFTNDDLTPLIDIVNEHYNARHEVRFVYHSRHFGRLNMRGKVSGILDLVGNEAEPV